MWWPGGAVCGWPGILGVSGYARKRKQWVTAPAGRDRLRWRPAGLPWRARTILPVHDRCRQVSGAGHLQSPQPRHPSCAAPVISLIRKWGSQQIRCCQSRPVQTRTILPRTGMITDVQRVSREGCECLHSPAVWGSGIGPASPSGGFPVIDWLVVSWRGTDGKAGQGRRRRVGSPRQLGSGMAHDPGRGARIQRPSRIAGVGHHLAMVRVTWDGFGGLHTRYLNHTLVS